MKITFLPLASKELEDAVFYYNDQLSGLGNQFFKEVQKAVDLISETPFGWRFISKNTRRINLRRFPYLILYVVEENEIIVTCVAHQHRDPKYYLSKTKKAD